MLRVDALTEPLVREHLQSLLGEQNVLDEFVRWMLWESAGSPLNIRRVIDYDRVGRGNRAVSSGLEAQDSQLVILGLRVRIGVGIRPGGAAFARLGFSASNF